MICIISSTDTPFQPYAVLDTKLKAIWNVRPRIIGNTDFDCLEIWQRSPCHEISTHLATGIG